MFLNHVRINKDHISPVSQIVMIGEKASFSNLIRMMAS